MFSGLLSSSPPWRRPATRLRRTCPVDRLRSVPRSAVGYRSSSSPSRKRRPSRRRWWWPPRRRRSRRHPRPPPLPTHGPSQHWRKESPARRAGGLQRVLRRMQRRGGSRQPSRRFDLRGLQGSPRCHDQGRKRRAHLPRAALGLQNRDDLDLRSEPLEPIDHRPGTPSSADVRRGRWRAVRLVRDRLQLADHGRHSPRR